MSVSLYSPKRFPWQKDLPVQPIVSKKSLSPKSSGEKSNLSAHRFPARPWHKVDASALKTHQQKRAERAVARWKAAA